MVEGIDYVECKICGVQSGQINGKHLKIHSITTKEYKEKYGEKSTWCEKSRIKCGVGKLGVISHRKNKKLTEEHKKKIYESNKKHNFGKGLKKHSKEWKLIQGKRLKEWWFNLSKEQRKEHSEKCSISLKGNPNLLGRIPWNKGLTKENDERVKEISNKLKKTYINRKDKYPVSDEFREKISKIVSDGISNGKYNSRFHYSKQGWYITKNGNNEYYDSSYELKRMKQLDNMNVTWTKKHGIRIPYIVDGKLKNYIPDFLVENRILEEVKPKSLLNNRINKIKFKFAIQFAKDNGYEYKIITEEHLDL